MAWLMEYEWLLLASSLRIPSYCILLRLHERKLVIR